MKPVEADARCAQRPRSDGAAHVANCGREKGNSIKAAVSQGTAAHWCRCRVMEMGPWVMEKERMKPCAASSARSHGRAGTQPTE